MLKKSNAGRRRAVKPPPTDLNIVEIDGPGLAEWLGLSARAVSALAANDRVMRLADGRFRLKDSVRGYCGFIRQRTGVSRSDADGTDASRQDNFAEGAALKKATRELAELKRDAISRKLISIEEITDCWGELVRNVRQLGAAIPERCREQMPHLTHDDFEKFRAIVRQTFAEAAEMVPADKPLIPGGGEADYVPPTIKPRRGRPPKALAAKRPRPGARISPIGKRGPRASLRPDR